MLPLRVVLDRNRGGSFLVFLLVGAGLFAMFLFLTYYFQVNLGYTPAQGRLRVPAVQPRHHPGRRRRVPAAPPGRPEGADAARPRDGRRRDAAADPDRPGHRRTGRSCFPAMVIMSVGLAGVFIPAASTSLIGVEQPRRGRGLRGAQHLPADRRLARHRAAQHAVRRRGHGVLHRQPADQPRTGPADRSRSRSSTATTWRSSGAPSCSPVPCSCHVRASSTRTRRTSPPTRPPPSPKPPDPAGRACRRWLRCERSEPRNQRPVEPVETRARQVGSRPGHGRSSLSKPGTAGRACRDPCTASVELVETNTERAC